MLDYAIYRSCPGGVLVPGSVVGQLLGGIIPKVAKLQFRGIMWMMIIAQFICIICALSFLASCPTPKIVGLNEDYPFNFGKLNILFIY